MKKSILIITLFLLALATTPALAQAPEGEEYIVQRGDWLMKLARTYYGYPEAFQIIVEATNAKAAEDRSFAFIRNPNLIVPGQKLWIPTQSETTMTPTSADRVTSAIELTTNPWLWQSFTDPLQKFELDNPEAYTISFNPDGTVNIQADCNNASGTYTANDSGSLSIQIGPMTRAACPPNSRSDEFVQKLGFVSNFFFENGFLYLDTMADGGTFQLASASEAMPGSEAMSETETASVLDMLYQQDSAKFASISASCPQRSFPMPDPEQSVKRPLDFSPFSDAMASFSPEQAAAIDSAIQGKTVLELQALLDGGQLSSEQLVLYYLDRIQRYDENLLNSIMELNPEALTIARELDAARANTAHGPLYGIPVTLKDNIATVGPMHTTTGNYALKDWQASRDSFLVTQLRQAGAIILGKNNLSEWANYTDPCMPSGFSALGGQTRNPNGPYDTLGSSSGSAVSVAADLTTVSVGSETAGSLVQPARINGVVGMRPSKGLVSGDYVIPLEPTLDTAGPMGRSVSDVAVLLTTLAATDPNEPRGADAAPLANVDFTQHLSLDEARTLRVGVVSFDRFALSADPDFATKPPEEQQQLLDLMTLVLNGATPLVIDALESQGIEVVRITESDMPPGMPPNIYTAFISYGFQDGIQRMFGSMIPPAPITSLADAVAIVNEDAAARAPYGQRYVEGSAETEISAEQYTAAVSEAQARAEAWLEALYQQYDIDVLMYGAAYTTGGSAGVPAINIPIGRIPNPETGEPGEPTGVYITGPYLSDAQLIAVGYALEQALDERVPPDLDATIEGIEAVIGQ